MGSLLSLDGAVFLSLLVYFSTLYDVEDQQNTALYRLVLV
jgi:hypothetical protein